MSNQTRKSTVDEIRERLDQVVENFSDLDTGQRTMIDSRLIMELVTDAAARCAPQATAVLDIGCGAGNYTLRLLEKTGPLDVSLVDLSRPMLDRAAERIGSMFHGRAKIWQGDIRQFTFHPEQYDIVLAAAVFHHLRGDEEWEQMFHHIWTSLRPGGGLWIADLVTFDDPRLRGLAWDRYGEFLAETLGADTRDRVFAYVEQEDTPRSVAYQTRLLARVGFDPVEVLHQHGCFAAIGAIKPQVESRGEYQSARERT